MDALKPLARAVAAITLALAVALLGVLPPEHVHEGDVDRASIVHRHAIDHEVATHGPALHAADHSTVTLIDAVFEAAATATFAMVLTPERPGLPVPRQTTIARLLVDLTPPIHGPPPRLGPPRAPPRS